MNRDKPNSNSNSVAKKIFIRHLSGIIKMRYINIYKLQGDSSYFSIDKPKDNIELAGKKMFFEVSITYYQNKKYQYI